jgi:hypothetical protein
MWGCSISDFKAADLYCYNPVIPALATKGRTATEREISVTSN